MWRGSTGPSTRRPWPAACRSPRSPPTSCRPGPGSSHPTTSTPARPGTGTGPARCSPPSRRRPAGTCYRTRQLNETAAGSPGAYLDLAPLVQDVPELPQRLLLVGSEAVGHHHLGAGPVRPGVLAAGRRADQERSVDDLDVIPHLVPGSAGRHQADRRLLAVVIGKVVKHRPTPGEGAGTATGSVQPQHARRRHP